MPESGLTLILAKNEGKQQYLPFILPCFCPLFLKSCPLNALYRGHFELKGWLVTLEPNF